MERDLFSAAYVPYWSEKLEQLAGIAIPEKWKFKKADPTRRNEAFFVLERYINQVFSEAVVAYNNELSLEEGDRRFLIREGYACFHTGLLSRRRKELFGYLEKNRREMAAQKYVLRGFFDDASPLMKKIGLLPEKPFTNLRKVMSAFQPDWPIRINVDHILDDQENYNRLPESIRNFPNLPLLLQAGVENARKTAEYIPTTVVHQVYNGELQLLLPICLTDPDKPDLAMTLTQMDGYYSGSTCLTLEMAYSNARLLATPTAPWLMEMVE